ncbi:hypothetical protein C1X64_02110 [Pseudomonas sp. GW456-E7]|nr:hypothetical protein C1X64_02110 [Pseudomonas sp. GW456-E7]
MLKGVISEGHILFLGVSVSELALSRASPLPHWSCVHRSNVGAGLLAKTAPKAPSIPGQIKPSCITGCLPS